MAVEERAPLSRASRARLTARHAAWFEGSTLFDRLGRVVSEAECLPRKELYEAWETCRRVRRRLRGGLIVDVAGGHGLAAFVMLLLDESSPGAICVDPARPASFDRLQAALVAQWPRLEGKVTYIDARLQDAPLPDAALFLGVHACGPLTDLVLDHAIARRSPVAVLPCCHSRSKCDGGALEGWLPISLAVDSTRVARMRSAGYAVYTSTIPEDITPENRLLVAKPGAAG